MPAVSYAKEEKPPAKISEAILNKPVSGTARKIEVPSPLPPVDALEDNRKIEFEYKKTALGMSRDDIKADIEKESIESEGWEDEKYREKYEGIASAKGPPAQKKVKSLPVFKPVTNDVGPAVWRGTAQDEDEGEAQTINSPELRETTGEYNYEGPAVPPGVETKPLPSFTPITNTTGPVATDKE